VHIIKYSHIMHTNSIEDTNMENIITEIVGTMLILPNTHINARNKNYSMLTIGIRTI
jgi:hypothetical protein